LRLVIDRENQSLTVMTITYCVCRYFDPICRRICVSTRITRLGLTDLMNHALGTVATRRVQNEILVLHPQKKLLKTAFDKVV
jgi:hypothetical protein